MELDLEAELLASNFDRNRSQRDTYFSIQSSQYTTLGCKYGSKEYSQRFGDTVITLMSYNILADCLAAMHPEVYTHCKDQGQDVLKWEYRFARLMQGIQQHNCDVICLQEVQCDHYEVISSPV